mmetsp:Transcript_680/g.1414  ORF Transcript_680/g.1414 Transcript_680/m.1414 type:complete len:276 (+) Transcript_680:1518-2345(+)
MGLHHPTAPCGHHVPGLLRAGSIGLTRSAVDGEHGGQGCQQRRRLFLQARGAAAGERVLVRVDHVLCACGKQAGDVCQCLLGCGRGRQPAQRQVHRPRRRGGTGTGFGQTSTVLADVGCTGDPVACGTHLPVLPLPGVAAASIGLALAQSTAARPVVGEGAPVALVAHAVPEPLPAGLGPKAHLRCPQLLLPVRVTAPGAPRAGPRLRPVWAESRLREIRRLPKFRGPVGVGTGLLVAAPITPFRTDASLLQVLSGGRTQAHSQWIAGVVNGHGG